MDRCNWRGEHEVMSDGRRKWRTRQYQGLIPACNHSSHAQPITPVTVHGVSYAEIKVSPADGHSVCVEGQDSPSSLEAAATEIRLPSKVIKYTYAVNSWVLAKLPSRNSWILVWRARLRSQNEQSAAPVGHSLRASVTKNERKCDIYTYYYNYYHVQEEEKKIPPAIVPNRYLPGLEIFQ